jgi:hypothetical protein
VSPPVPAVIWRETLPVAVAVQQYRALSLATTTDCCSV